MRLVSFGPRGEERPGVLEEDTIVDLRAADAGLPATLRQILAADRLDDVQRIAAAPEAPRVPAAGVRLGPPILEPDKIVCLGLNYADHAAEQDRPLPERPLLFAKAPTALIGCRDAIELPEGEDRVDVEAELAVVVGRRARRLRAADWRQVVAGYMVFNDVSGRRAQYSDRQWFRGKSFDTFAPCGPALVTADAIPDPHDLAIGSRVNDFVMQSSHTGQLVFRIPELLEYISAAMTLLPGDLVATGTPAGVGVFRDPPRFLSPGDTVTVHIEDLGTLQNPVVDGSDRSAR